MSTKENKVAKSVTLGDLAESLGLSRHTVGRILSDKAHLHNKKTVQRVLEAADQMGYRPNLLAKGIRSGSSLSVGVLIGLENDQFSSNILKGLQDGLLENHYLPVILIKTPGQSEQALLHCLLDRQVDGVILKPFFEDRYQACFAELEKRGIPCVQVNTPLRSEHHFCGTDDLYGGRMAAQHLLDKGYRKVAIFSFADETLDVQQREQGFRATISGRSEVEVFKIQEAYDAVNLSLTTCQTLDRVEAVFALSDQLAYRIYGYAKRSGRSIPSDLAILGYGGLGEAEIMYPPLSSVCQDGYAIGKRTATLMFDTLNGNIIEGETTIVRIKPKLIERGST